MTDRLEDKRTTGCPTVSKLYTVEQAAEVAQEPVEEICRRIRIGKLKAYHLGGNRVRIDDFDLLADIQPQELEW